MKKQTSHNYKSNINYLVYIILILSFSILTLVLYSQKVFSHKIESIVVRVNTGPVSPEFQATRTLEISPNSCMITTTKTVSQEQTQQNCNLSAQEYTSIEEYAKQYDLADKIVSNQAGNSGLLGSKEYYVQINYKDGTSISAQGGSNFYTGIQPFIGKLQTYIPEFE